MKKISLLAGVATFALAGTAAAQTSTFPTSPVTLEVRGGAAFPVDADGLNVGYTLGANAAFAVTPMFGVYAGYTLNSFGVDFGDVGLDASADAGSARVRLHGFDAGVKASFAPMGRVAPFVRGGLVVEKASLSVSSDEGSGSFSDNDYRVGFEVGGGVAIPLGPRVSVTPAASFVKVDDAKWVKADVGLAVHI